MLHKLEIVITQSFTLEQVEMLKDYLYDCIIKNQIVKIESDSIELIVTDSQ